MKQKLKNNELNIIVIFLVAISLGLVSCKHYQNEDSKDNAQEHNKAKLNNTKEAKFLVEATEISLHQIELAKLAQSNGGSSNIRDMGKMMETDHRQFLMELKKIAKSKSVSIPVEATINMIKDKNKLVNKTGNDFDKQYCDMLVEGQKEAINKYKSATEDLDETDIKNWALKTLSAIRNQLDHAITCKEAYKNYM